MLNNLSFWYRQAQGLKVLTQNLAEKLDDPAQREEAVKLMRQLLACRDTAQRCAVEAAPYVHPRLASIGADIHVRRSLEEYSDAELSALLGGDDAIGVPEGEA